MSVWQTLRNALGLQRPLEVHDPTVPLRLTEAAQARLVGLGEDQGIHVETTEAPGGRLVQVTEGARQGPAAPGYEAWSLTASDADLDRLRGRILDVHQDRWTISVPLELRARETPNPDSRLYLSSQPLAEGAPAFFVSGADAGGEVPALAARLMAIEGVRSLLLRDNTVTVERVPSTPWDGLDRKVDIALREHFLLCGRAVKGERLATTDDGKLSAAVRQVLAEKVAPAIHRDGGDIELVGVSQGVVKVSLVGACRSCPASAMTLQHGVERTLKEAFPGQIERVEQV
ncbi:MAG: NifU family protein [Myxococcota bacterium]